MSKGPGLFSDIGKKARDLLTKDYNYDQKFSVSSTSEAGLGLTSTTVKKGGLYTGEVGLLYKYRNTNVDLKVDAASNVCTTLTFNEVLPSTKAIASFRAPDFNSGKAEMQYFHEHASFTTAVALSKSPTIDASATIGAQGIAFGVEAGFNASSKNLTKYTAGISMAKPDSSSAIILADKGDVLKISYLHYLGEKQRSALVGEITRRFSTNENTFTAGGSHAIDPQTTFKAKLNNHGKLGALLQHELKPKSLLTLSGEFDTKALEKYPKFGLSLAIKP
ncbi:Mitochondrial outer membrane protein porin 5 [Acorus calamus]|uniref:Mitochondrial outer membrane protein porin 5 n=1 Tax=Acorus calamus TaxID=4465 RepID=A0AAV9CTN6_ACOCL|nr:Mitochondrial outer membrane protein porin 5 [Acorus calamus]